MQLIQETINFAKSKKKQDYATKNTRQITGNRYSEKREYIRNGRYTCTHTGYPSVEDCDSQPHASENNDRDRPHTSIVKYTAAD